MGAPTMAQIGIYEEIRVIPYYFLKFSSSPQIKTCEFQIFGKQLWCFYLIIFLNYPESLLKNQCRY